MSFVGTTGSVHSGEVCGATGIDLHSVTPGTPSLLAENITWSAAKSSCGGYMNTTKSNGLEETTFILQVTYLEELYDFSADPPLSTGLTRTVANNYKFVVVTPYTFIIPSTGSVLLFGTTAMITSQNSTVSSSGNAAIMVSIFSDCSNTLTFPSYTDSASDFLYIASGPHVASTVTTGIPLASSKPAPSSGSFNGLCQWDVVVQITPSVTLCTLTGNYTILFTINYPDTSTRNFNSWLSIVSSDVCTDVQYQVASPDFAVNLYRRLEDSSAGVPGIPPTASINSGAGADNTVSKYDTAHGRLDIVPHVGTPVIQTFTLNQLCWSSVSASDAGSMTSGLQCISANTSAVNFTADNESPDGTMGSITSASLNTPTQLIVSSSTGLLAVGQTVVGPAVPIGTTITDVSGSTITLSNAVPGLFSGPYSTRAISNAVGSNSTVFFRFMWDPTFFTVASSAVSRSIFVAVTFSVDYVAPSSTRSMPVSRTHRAVMESSHFARRPASKYSAIARPVTFLASVDATTIPSSTTTTNSNTGLVSHFSLSLLSDRNLNSLLHRLLLLRRLSASSCSQALQCQYLSCIARGRTEWQQRNRATSWRSVYKTCKEK